MRFTEFNQIDEAILLESRGLASRKVGDVFTSNGGEDMTFQGIEFYPQTGKFEDPEELAAEIDNAENEFGIITWLNNPPKTGGFGVVSFETKKGDIKHYGRFFKVVKAMHDQMSWSNKDIPGYGLASKAGVKETAGMQPSDVLTQNDNNTPATIVKQIGAKFGKDHILTKVAAAVARGKKFPIKIPAQEGLSFEAYRDYFSEMLHPIALMKHTTSGNASEAEQQFLPGSSFAECSISFSTSKTEGLSDSILVNPEGQNIKVSSKGKSGGAQASIKNLTDAIHELKNPKLIKKHKEIIDLIDTVTSAGAKEAPSELAIHYKMINPKEAGLITRMATLVDSGKLNHKKVLKGGYLTKRLQKIYENRVAKDASKVNPHAHMVAALAFLVSDHINNKSTFSKSASEILNHAGLVTVDTKAKETSKEWIIEDFESKFPGESITGVLLSAQKNYSSTMFRGNFTFKILKNNANPKVFADVKPDDAPDKKKAPKKKAAKKSLSAASGGTKKPAKGTTQRSKR